MYDPIKDDGHGPEDVPMTEASSPGQASSVPDTTMTMMDEHVLPVRSHGSLGDEDHERDDGAYSDEDEEVDDDLSSASMSDSDPHDALSEVPSSQQQEHQEEPRPVSPKSQQQDKQQPYTGGHPNGVGGSHLGRQLDHGYSNADSIYGSSHYRSGGLSGGPASRHDPMRNGTIARDTPAQRSTASHSMSISAMLSNPIDDVPTLPDRAPEPTVPTKPTRSKPLKKKVKDESSSTPRTKARTGVSPAHPRSNWALSSPEALAD